MAAPASTHAIDVLIRNGRVIDPETNLDAIRDVAIAGGRIVAIAPHIDLDGNVPARVVDANKRVVAPGFIDLHRHGQSAKAHEYQARDGVTTALELEWGYPEVGAFLESRRGRARVHFGASASHGGLRVYALEMDAAAKQAVRQRMIEAVRLEEPLDEVERLEAPADKQPLDADQQRVVLTEIQRNLRAGALGVGMAHAYYPGADRAEILRVFEAAATFGAPIFTHVRIPGLEGVQEVIADAAATGAQLHIVHVNSTSLGEIGPVLDLIRGARSKGVDVTVEAYPYTAASTTIQSALFDGDWQKGLSISYADLQWQDTGERLTAETFGRYRALGGTVIMHMMKEAWVDAAIANDWVMVASDGMPYAPGAHPRSAGTFARVLGRYVRERRLLDLPTAIRKMTLLPAQRLESIAPQMKRKGRLQVGADADLVVFDPDTVIDTATFESGPSFSEGIDYVFVSGVAVVEDGELVADAYPGEAVVGRVESHQ